MAKATLPKITVTTLKMMLSSKLASPPTIIITAAAKTK